MSFILKSADFTYGATQLKDLPPVDFPEIAVVGRSNVGKSSLINRLTGRKKLARVSNTPGRTQQANLFTLRYDSPHGKNLNLALVDLPGFGFAKVSKTKRAGFEDLLVAYLGERPTLKAVVLLNDCRRMPQEQEIFIQKYLFEQEIYCLITLTKCDKLKKHELSKQLEILAPAYGLATQDIILTGKDTSLASFWERVLFFLGNVELTPPSEKSEDL